MCVIAVITDRSAKDGVFAAVSISSEICSIGSLLSLEASANCSFVSRLDTFPLGRLAVTTPSFGVILKSVSCGVLLIPI